MYCYLLRLEPGKHFADLFRALVAFSLMQAEESSLQSEIEKQLSEIEAVKAIAGKNVLHCSQ